MAKIKWRKWNRVVHRDLGYICVGLTVIYAISGIAVNHFRDWNPNFKVTDFVANVGPVADQNPREDQVVEGILQVLDLGTEYRSTFVPEPGSLEIFLDGGTVLVNLATGDATVELVRPRRGFQEANAMHLNQVGGLWTVLADLYAVILLVVAITGLFVIKGKKGIAGRGAWLTAAGTVVPLLLFFLYR